MGVSFISSKSAGVRLGLGQRHSLGLGQMPNNGFRPFSPHMIPTRLVRRINVRVNSCRNEHFRTFSKRAERLAFHARIAVESIQSQHLVTNRIEPEDSQKGVDSASSSDGSIHKIHGLSQGISEMKTLLIQRLLSRKLLATVGALSLLIATTSGANAQTRGPARDHGLLYSPAARAERLHQACEAAPMTGGNLLEEYRGSPMSQALDAMIGIDPVPVAGAFVNQASSPVPFGITPNSVLRDLPHIDERLGGDSSRNERVFGQDTRRRVTSTTAVPWRWTCELIITMPDGKKYIGTGWLVGPRCVMTAGHCVHDGGTGSDWAKSIEVIPGMNGSSRPYGTLVSRSFITVGGWYYDRDFDYDYGCIILPSPIGNRLGYMGVASYSNSVLRRLTLNTAGYPGDKPFGTMWFTTGRVSGMSNYQIYTQMDLIGGQSGSAVWRVTGGKRYAFGIVSAESSSTNYLLRINSSVLANIKRFRAM